MKRPTRRSKITPPAQEEDEFPIRVTNGSSCVSIYRYKSRGTLCYQLAYYLGGERRRRTFTDLEKAKLEANQIAGTIKTGITKALDLKGYQREAYVAAVQCLKPSGIPLVSAVEEYMRIRKLLGGTPPVAAIEEYTKCRRKLKGVTLTSAIDEYMDQHKGVEKRISTTEAVRLFIRSKGQDGASLSYMHQLSSDVRRFAAAYPGPILQIKSHHIDAWLRKIGGSLQTRFTIHTSIRTFFSWAKAHSYLPRNEITAAEALPKVKPPPTEAEIFTPDQLTKILALADEECIPYITIGAFAGLRAAEITRLDWSAVDLDRRIIIIRAGQAKTASRRIAPITDNLAQWLAPHIAKGKIITDSEIYRRITPLARQLGFKWPNNVLRHSFISYRIAIVKSAEQVALEAGNSAAIIFKHYRELATEQEAEAWFDIGPNQVILP